MSGEETIEVRVDDLESAVRELETVLDTANESDRGHLESLADDPSQDDSDDVDDQLGSDAPIQVSVNHGQLRTVAYAAAEFVDYVAVQFTKDAIEVNFGDPAHVAHVAATIPITEWNAPPRTGEIVLDTEDFTETLWGLGISDTEIRADPETNRFALLDCSIPYRVATADGQKKPVSPSMDYAAKLTTRARLPGYHLAAGLSGASAASDLNVGIAIQEGTLTIAGHRRDEDAYVTPLEFDAETIGPDAAAVYSESFISEIASHIPGDTTVELQLRNDFPVLVDAGYIRLALAPRATGEEDSEHSSNLLDDGGEADE